VAGPINPSTPCPCGSFRAYGECCGALHAGTPAADAEHLMRARYCAYVLQREDYLLDTWHPETRPMALHLAAQQPAPTWLGLDVRAHDVDDADHARVEFVARLRIGGGRAQRMHEHSRFVREKGHWLYVDGDVRER